MPTDGAARVDAIVEQSQRRFTTPVSVVDSFVDGTFTAPDISV